MHPFQGVQFRKFKARVIANLANLNSLWKKVVFISRYVDGNSQNVNKSVTTSNPQNQNALWDASNPTNRYHSPVPRNPLGCDDYRDKEPQIDQEMQCFY